MDKFRPSMLQAEQATRTGIELEQSAANWVSVGAPAAGTGGPELFGHAFCIAGVLQYG